MLMNSGGQNERTLISTIKLRDRKEEGSENFPFWFWGQVSGQARGQVRSRKWNRVQSRARNRSLLMSGPKKFEKFLSPAPVADSRPDSISKKAYYPCHRLVGFLRLQQATRILSIIKGLTIYNKLVTMQLY